MKNLKYFLVSSILITSSALAANTGEYMSVINNIHPEHGSLVGKPLDLHVGGVNEKGEPTTYVIPPGQSSTVYLWHDGTVADINVSYQAYYAGTNTIVDPRTLPGIKVYFNGEDQKFPCNNNVTIHYAPSTPSEEYLWTTLTCK